MSCDPCTRYGGGENQNSGFVIGGPTMNVRPLADPRPLEELVIYELMIDDFTAGFRADRAPLAAVRDKLDYLQCLGINAVEFLRGPSGPERDSTGVMSRKIYLPWPILTPSTRRMMPRSFSCSRN